ncbi:hypothetical protein BGX29_000470 [Mortierella sp. GBA35]|nr:hypothetical protein BGX29_000470 [Mortierella sp. GBA35]
MTTRKPMVHIVGAGLGGLMLANLLETMEDVDYLVFERSTTLKPYGAGMALGPNIIGALHQIGLGDELVRVSLPVNTMDIYNDDLSLVGSMSGGATYRENVGYDTHLFSRPHLHRLLLLKIPPEKVRYGKKVLSIGQSEYGTLIRCSDKTSYEADILVGADGAYSAVRQSLYERLKKEKTLPKKDGQSLDVGYTCLVGTTMPLDPEKYPVLKKKDSDFAIVLSNDRPHSWTSITVPGNRVCWGVNIQLTTEEREGVFRNSEWGPESIDPTIAKVADHKMPIGGTLGDLINATPKELISKVYLEEKFFETWVHGRTALIGDACHKMLPTAGQGATNAMQDAVILANCIYEMVSLSNTDVEDALKSYKKQRYSFAKQSVASSSMAAKVLYGQTRLERFLRKVVLNWLPASFEKSALTKSVAYRPQATFLPRIPDRGTFPVLPQPVSKRWEREQKELRENPPLAPPAVQSPTAENNNNNNAAPPTAI